MEVVLGLGSKMTLGGTMLMTMITMMPFTVLYEPTDCITH